METTKVKENGQANVNTVRADKNPKFVAGNPVNAVSEKSTETKEQQPKAEEKPQTPISPVDVDRLKISGGPLRCISADKASDFSVFHFRYFFLTFGYIF